jgi:exodeoxyribonuclease V alpha subunit
MKSTLVIANVWPGINGIGGAVFTGTSCNDGRLVRCKASADRIFRAPSRGELWEIEGDVILHPHYGEQLQVRRALPVAARGRLIVSYLAYNSAFEGIGKAKAERLWAAFGDELPAVLARGDAEALAPHLGEKAIASLLANWRELPETEIVAFLDQYGFPLGVTNRILRVWPTDTIKKLQANPYRILAVTSWSETDRAANRMGLALDDPRRLIGAVEAALYNELAEHHTITPRPLLMGSIQRLLPTLSQQHVETALRLALEDRACVESELGISTIGAAHMEQHVGRWLFEKCEREPQGDIFDATLEVILADEAKKFQTARGKEPSTEQLAAVQGIFSNRLFILTGGAGTGKTSVLSLVHSVAARTGRQVVQMCLAGRAAKRLADATGQTALTIASFFLHHGKILGRVGDPIVIIDESSMVDLPAFYLLSKLLPEGATVVLVGDAAQLPPIGFGLVFHKLSAASAPRQELSRIYRQSQNNSIPAIAEQIRRFDDATFAGCGRVPILPNYSGPAPGAFIVESDSEQIAEHVLALRKSLSGQILCATHGGVAGDDKLNSLCHRRFVGTSEDTPNICHTVGEPVIFGENDYNRTTVDGAPSVLWNGSMGTVVEVRHDPEYSLIVDFDGESHELTGNDLTHLRHAFAITVHRAQGSQFPVVIVPLVKARNVDRTWLYTAITRAERTAILVGPSSIFSRAVTAPPHADHRRVGLMLGPKWKNNDRLFTAPS